MTVIISLTIKRMLKFEEDNNRPSHELSSDKEIVFFSGFSPRLSSHASQNNLMPRRALEGKDVTFLYNWVFNAFIFTNTGSFIVSY